MRKVSVTIVAAVMGLSACLAGCGTIDKLTGSAPGTAQAIAVATPCLISLAAAAAIGIEVDINAGQSAQGTTVKVQLASADACKAIGGLVAAVDAATP